MADKPKSVDVAIAELTSPEVRFADLEVLFEESPSGISMIHADGTFLRTNQVFCGLVGYNSSELVRKRKLTDLTHPDDVDSDEAEIGKIVSGESDGYQTTKRYLNKRGNSVWVQQYITPVRTEEGVFLHCVAHATHIPLSEEFYRVETNAEGAAALKPYYPLIMIIRQNWKAFSGAAVVMLGSAGTVVTNYLEMRGDAAANRQTIDQQKQQIEELRRQIDRVVKKTGAE